MNWYTILGLYLIVSGYFGLRYTLFAFEEGRGCFMIVAVALIGCIFGPLFWLVDVTTGLLESIIDRRG